MTWAEFTLFCLLIAALLAITAFGASWIWAAIT